MEKKEALIDFVMGFQMSLNNAAYFRGHPYFITAAEGFKAKCDALLAFLNPIEINVLAESLVLDGQAWVKPALFVELARTLHQRKIQSITFKQGLVLDELILLLNAVSLSFKDISTQGGIKRILTPDKTPHIIVKQVDYSSLLQATAEECEEVLAALGDPAQEKDPQKVNEFSENFGLVMGKFKGPSLLNNEKLKANINKFLTHLKQTQKDKFDQCARQLYQSVSKDKDVVSELDAGKISSLFDGFSEDDFARLLLSEISSEENFDVLSFQFFSRIAGEKRSSGIASTLAGETAVKDSLRHNPRAQKNLESLLSSPDKTSVSDVYRNTLSELLKNISFGEGAAFDRKLLEGNYRHILLGILSVEVDKERLGFVAQRLSGAWPEIKDGRDWEYIRRLFDTLEARKKSGSDLGEVLAEVEKNISEFIEGLLWGEENVELGYFVDKLPASGYDADFYLNKIFKEAILRPQGLLLFFRFFPGKMPAFYDLLKAQRQNIDFLLNFIACLRQVGHPVVPEVLGYIYSCADQIVKVEALKAMQGRAGVETGLLFQALSLPAAAIKQEAFFLLAKNESQRAKAVEILLGIPNSFGLKNDIVLENMGLIENVGAREAESFLLAYSKNYIFWHARVRKKAREILAKWHTEKK
jgi:hypothetical protein